MATTDRSGRTQCQAKKTGNIEKRSSATCGGQNDVKASVNNTWQISPFCHML